MNDTLGASNALAIIDQVLDSYRTNPVDLLNIGDAAGEYKYLVSHKQDYVRTVLDILRVFEGKENSQVRVLEIGSFLGLVSLVLARLGFRVTATDIEEYIGCSNLRKRFDDAGVTCVSCNLRSYRLPFANEEFGVVVMCETLEHLNFNPLPVIKEINRVMRPQGVLYLALPNIARLRNRLNLLEGRSLHDPISTFFAQLDRNDNNIVGLHWREYTIAETREMLEKMDFAVELQKYESEEKAPPHGLVKKCLARILNSPRIRRLVVSCLLDPDLDPSLSSTQVTVARKAQMCTREFFFTDATRSS